MEVYAYWVEDDNADFYKITFMKNFGSGKQKFRELAISEAKGVLTSTPLVSRKGYQLLGWYTKASNGKRIRIGDKITSDITLYAHWKKIKVQRVSIKQLYGKDKAIMVKYKKQSGVKGYQVQVSTSKTFAKKKTITKTYGDNSTFKRTIKKLKKGKTYYIRIRAYKKDSAGCKVYGKWSKVQTVTTK